MAAIELVHKQPVRWTKEKLVSCDGGGGPLGHPRIFVNVDRPQIIPCGYCGLPFVGPTSLLSQSLSVIDIRLADNVADNQNQI